MGSATRWLSALVLLALATACGGGGSGGPGRVKVLVTDKPFDLDLIKEAVVHVTKITLGPAGDDGDHEDGNDDDQGDDDQGDDDQGNEQSQQDHHDGDGHDFVTLYSGPGIEVSLLGLRNGVSAELTTGEVPAGRYSQARLFIDDARLTLTNGNVYSTADGNLDLTCANSTGLTIFFDPPLDVAAGADTAILLDFDLSKTFIPIPDDDPANAQKFLISSGIRAINRVNTGDLRGTVTQDDGAGGEVGVDLATVYVLPPGETDPANSVASTASTGDGSYAVLGLKPGTYDVLAVKDAKQAKSVGVEITAAHETTVDLLVQ